MNAVRRVADPALELLVPALLIVLAGVLGSLTKLGTRDEFVSALVNVTIVVALYIFIGNSGVLSFGHISFVAIGAFGGGVMAVDALVKPTTFPALYRFISHHSVGNVTSLLLAAGLGAVFALVVGIPLMRLSGLAAGIATFAVLGIVHNVLRYWEGVSPGAQTLSLVPQTTGLLQATIGGLIAAVVAFVYQKSRFGRLLRATREDAAAAQAAGIDIHRQRFYAWVISGALAGFAGGLLVHQLGSIDTEQVYLELTFLTLAMLVVGGSFSLLGAVVGALAISALESFLFNAENGVNVVGMHLNLPAGTSLVIIGVVMAIVLVLRPTGITGGREASLHPRRVARPRFARTTGQSGTPAA